MIFEDEIFEICADVLNVKRNEISLTRSLLHDYKVDSLQLAEIVVRVEEVIGINLDIKKIIEKDTLLEFINYIKSSTDNL